MSPETYDVVVVGGGLAGIAAAATLAPHRRVLLLEAGEALGGKAGTLATARGAFPTGPASFNGRHAAFWRLLGLLGLDAQARPVSTRSRARYVVRSGRLEGLEPSPLSILSTGALSLSDKLNLARDFLSTRRGVHEDEPLDGFLERRFGRALVDGFFAAVLTGIYAGDLTKLSARACMPALVTAEREYGSVLRGLLLGRRPADDGTRPGLFALEGGFGAVGEVAARRLPTRTGVRVTGLTQAPGGLALHGVDADGPLQLRATHVVIATEAPAAAALLRPLAAEAAATLERFDYAPVTLLHWAERFPGESRLPTGFGYLTPPREARFALGTLFVGDLRDEAPRRFSTFIGGALTPGRAALPDEALEAGVADDVRHLTGGALGEVAGVTRWPQAVFQPPVGHEGQLAKLTAALGTLPVSLAGSYLGGAAMKDAIASGLAAGQALLTAPPPPAPGPARLEAPR